MLKRSIFICLSLLSIISLTFYGFSFEKVSAAGVSTTITPSALLDSTATEVNFVYNPSVEYQSGDIVTITVDTGVTLTACASPTTDSDGAGGADGSSVTSSPTYTYTYSSATTNGVSGGVTFCLKLSAATGNYSISFTDSKAVSSNNDYGAALIYVGSANVVTVTAQVQPALAFSIRNTVDNGTTNVCALGTLSLLSVNTCSYRLKITTNSASGYTIQIDTDGDLRRSGSGNVADNLDIDIIADNGTVTAGTEGYGISLTGGSITGGTLTEAPTASYTFQTDSSPLPINSPQNFITTNGTNNPLATDTTNTSLVTHSAAMDGDTNTGNYSQLVTYTVSASF